MHSKNVIHRDISTRNVLVDSSGKMMISDFGLSKFLSNSVHYFHSRVGNEVFMAPEIKAGCSNKFSNKVDMYSLGVTIFALWTG